MHFRNGRAVGTSHSFVTIFAACALLGLVGMYLVIAYFWWFVAATVVSALVWLSYAYWREQTAPARASKLLELQAAEERSASEAAEQLKVRQLAAVLAESERLRAEVNRQP